MTDDVLKHLREASQRRRQADYAAVAAARLAPGKEPFDIERLNALYDLSWDLRGRPMTSEVIEGYERRYYLETSDVKTLQQFADYLVCMRDNDAN